MRGLKSVVLREEIFSRQGYCKCCCSRRSCTSKEPPCPSSDNEVSEVCSGLLGKKLGRDAKNTHTLLYYHSWERERKFVWLIASLYMKSGSHFKLIKMTHSRYFHSKDLFQAELFLSHNCNCDSLPILSKLHHAL